MSFLDPIIIQINIHTCILIEFGNRNGWEYWKDENGKPLNDDKDLKKRVTGK